MCGIVGVYSFDKNHPLDRELLIRQNDTLTHRGPDDGGLWVEQGVALGQRRLSIIDLSPAGHQPMWDVERRVGVVFNGEIYNYKELRAQLEPKGHVFQSDSDTETIIHAYREWGEACVQRFRGMFAFAVYDRDKRIMFLARDRLGKKPLYYYFDDRRLIFASEIKAIIEDPSVPRVIEPTAVADFFAYNYVPGPGTIFQKIKKLPAGHFMVVSGDRYRIGEYWDVDFTRLESPGIEQAGDELLAELREAVRLRLRSDVPLGAFLSGGIDSSLVVGLMARQLEQPVKTHTIGFSEHAYDERTYARETAQLFHTDHAERVVSVDALDVLDRLSWFYDEPFGDSSAVPTYYLCGATRERVTVSLSGDGGDENFAGYRRYAFAMIEDDVRRRLPGLVRRGFVSPLARLYPKADYLPQFLRAKSTLTNIAVGPERAYFLSLTQKAYPRFLSRDFMNGLGGYDPFLHMEQHFARSRTEDPLSRLQYVDLKMYLTDDILVKVDRASMAHALEVRVPILDHAVVERAARLPAGYKLAGGKGKLVLKKAAAQILPESIFARKKMGFSIPLAEWFRTGLKERAEATFFSEPGGRSGLLDPGGLRRMWYEHQLGIKNHATSLWSILMFEGWVRRFIDRAAPSVEPRGSTRSPRPTQLM